MGKFSGMLICSDFDGTFATATEPIPESVEAIRYFVENGGYFTVATGRLVEFIREKGVDRIINAPACLCNGSVIYDYANSRLLTERRLPVTTGDVLTAMKELEHTVFQFHVFRDICDGGYVYTEDPQAFGPDFLQAKPLKIMCKFHTVEDADAYKRYAMTHPRLKDCYICKSFRLGVEFNAANATKGDAVDFLREYLQDVYTVVGIGDFENDLPLLQRADIGAAPENAVDVIQSAARLKVRRHTEGAFVDLIEQLEKSI